MASGYCSQSRVEPSRSVKRKVTVPDGSSATRTVKQTIRAIAQESALTPQAATRVAGRQLLDEELARVEVVGRDHEEARVAAHDQHIVEPMSAHADVREAPAVQVAAHDVGLESHDATEQVLGRERARLGTEALDTLRRML